MWGARRAAAVAAATLAVVTFVPAGGEAQERGRHDGPAAVLDSLARAAVDDGFSGQVLVVRDGDVLLHEGYGPARPDGSVAVDTSTVFAVGSVTKRFTRAAVLRLAEEGRLSLSDPLSRWLDGLPEDKRAITVGHVVDMAAGFDEYHDTEGDHQPMTRAEALDVIGAQELRFEPGTDRAYSNSGYTLLAAVIEEASGESWEAYLRSALFEPAGMDRTGFHGEDLWPDERVARGYGGRTHGDNAPNTWPFTWALKGAGGMVAPASDLLRFIRASRAGEVLGPRGVAALYPEDEPTLLYAGGDDFGFITFVMELDHGRHFVIVSTNSGYRLEPLVRAMAAVVRGEPLPEPRVAGGGRQVEIEGGDAGEGGQAGQGGEAGGGLPDSPRGRAARTFLGALEDGSDEALRALVEDGFTAEFRDFASMEDHLRILGDLADRVREEGVRGVRPRSEFSLEIVLEGGDAVILDIEPAEPHRIEGVRIGSG